MGVWRGFYRHAAQVTSLSHFASVDIKEFMGALSGTFEEVACNGDTSLVCVYWSEFDLDPGTDIGCFPNTAGTNIVSPTELLAEMRNSGIQYPPPSPPPPEPPTPPPSPAPPPDEQMCSIRSLPDASFLKDHSNGAPAPPPGSRAALPTNRETRAVPCWRWDENLLWPPRQAHQDFFEPQSKCAGKSSLAVQWDTAFRQSRLSEKYHHLHNSDSYTGANNGVCDDGGDGDLSGRSAAITMKSGGMAVADSASVPVCTKANNAQVYTQEYIFTRIEPFLQQDKFPGIGQEIWILDDLITGEGTRNTAVETENGRIIGPLKVIEAYRNTCDDASGSNKCLCTTTEALNNPERCSGHALGSAASDGVYPRQYSYIRAESIVNADADCALVTDGLPTNGRVTGLKYSNLIAYGLGNSVESCGHQVYCNEASCQEGLDGINEKANDRYKYYECGMRKANYIFAHSNDYCPYGADRSDCGDRDDIVSYGRSSANRCEIMLYTQDSTIGTTQLQNLYPGANSIAVPVFPPADLHVGNPQWTNGECNDRGSSQVIPGTCIFGTDSDDCGYRELTMPRGKVFNRAPDDSCPSANNGLCEDQLYYSNVAPNDIEMSGREICIPNTDLSDCGWRSGPRNIPVEVLRGDSCSQPGGVLYGATDNTKSICQDLNDFWALGPTHTKINENSPHDPNNYRLLVPGTTFLGIEEWGHTGLLTCGFGTHTEQCGERVVYVHEDAPGGCEQTCNDPLMEQYIDPTWKQNNNWDPKTYCSDGGEGSRRILFLMPQQRDPRGRDVDTYYQHRQEIYTSQRYRYWDFACEPMLFF